MDISYTYTIESVDKESKTMLVKYESTGLITHIISARMPSVDETLEQIIEMYSPVQAWEIELLDVADVAVGASGSLTKVDTTVGIDNQEGEPPSFTE
jgi:hypothetical protein